MKQWWIGSWRNVIILVVALGLAVGWLALMAIGGQATGRPEADGPAQNQAALEPHAPRGVHLISLPMILRQTQPALNRRLGVGAAAHPNPSRYAEFASLRLGWYQNWSTQITPDRPQGMEFVQTVRVHEKLTCPLSSAQAHDRVQCPYVQPHDYLFSPDATTITAAAGEPGRGLADRQRNGSSRLGGRRPG